MTRKDLASEDVVVPSCQLPDGTYAHDWKWEHNGGDSWQFCRRCGAEKFGPEDELDECPQCGSTSPHFHGDNDR